MSVYSRVYRIADVDIEISSPHYIEQIDSFRVFEADVFLKGYKVCFFKRNDIPGETGIYLSQSNEYKVYYNENGFVRYFFAHDKDKQVYARTIWNWKKHMISVDYLEQEKRFLNQSGNAFFHIGLEQIMLRENRLIFHAACVETVYGGVLFTGPAGAGKSTQADLWIKHRDGFLINGDRPILSVDENGWKAWGSPYAGSSRCHVNKCCDVKAIVRVVQNSDNKIIRLKGSRAFSTVFSGVTVNDWSREDVCVASELVIQLINTIPVYEMYCTKTEEAVEILENVLKGEMN